VTSRHEAFGALVKKAAAVADAEQIAPTDTTETGVPPASDCAVTLWDAVLKFWRSWRGGASVRGPSAAHSGWNENRFRCFGCAALPAFWTTMRNTAAAPVLT